MYWVLVKENQTSVAMTTSSRLLVLPPKSYSSASAKGTASGRFKPLIEVLMTVNDNYIK